MCARSVLVLCLEIAHANCGFPGTAQDPTCFRELGESRDCCRFEKKGSRNVDLPPLVRLASFGWDTRMLEGRVQQSAPSTLAGTVPPPAFLLTCELGGIHSSFSNAMGAIKWTQKKRLGLV
jgi:hypothetical protein